MSRVKKAAVRFDPDDYVKIEYDEVAPSVKTTIIKNGEIIEPTTNYVTEEQLTNILSDYVNSEGLTAALADYATKSMLNNYAPISALANYALITVLADYAPKSMLADYITGTELENELANYITGNELTTLLNAYATIEQLNEHLAVTNHDTELQELAGSSNVSPTITATKEGYYPLGIVGYHTLWTSGETSQLNYYSMRLTAQSEGSATASISVRNTHTATAKFKVKVFILWYKVE